jgi:hypothetical protein
MQQRLIEVLFSERPCFLQLAEWYFDGPVHGVLTLQ